MSSQRRLAATLFASVFLSSLAWHANARPPKRDPPLLFGGPVTKPKPKLPLDPRLPTGVELPATQPRPRVTASRCSFTRPVCVHATSPLAEAGLSEALAALESAYERIVL